MKRRERESACACERERTRLSCINFFGQHGAFPRCCRFGESVDGESCFFMLVFVKTLFNHLSPPPPPHTHTHTHTHHPAHTPTVPTENIYEYRHLGPFGDVINM